MLIFMVVLGFAAGFALCHFQWKAAYRELYDASIKALKDKHSKNTKAIYIRVRAKVDEINKIMEAQLALWGHVDGPNKGSSHSRWKRDLINKVNDLESEKIEAFRDILNDGVDLTVSVIDHDGSKTSKKMSQIVEEFDASKLDEPSLSDEKPAVKNEPIKKLRLVKESNLSLKKDDNHDGQSE